MDTFKSPALSENTFDWNDALLSNIGLSVSDLGFVAYQTDSKEQVTSNSRVYTPVFFEKKNAEQEPIYTIIFRSGVPLKEVSAQLYYADKRPLATAGPGELKCSRPDNNLKTFVVALPTRGLTSKTLYQLNVQAEPLSSSILTIPERIRIYIP
ncbi:MAG: hypothetical protein JXB05_09390 [Myxococcaceae bacterium]|nr:hypothetical protein [Myxococcaceae bacterium]